MSLDEHSEKPTWNQQLKTWMDNNPDGAKEIREVVPASTLRDWLRESITNLDRVNIATKANVYNITSLEVFNFEGYTDPNKIDPVKAFEDRSYSSVSSTAVFSATMSLVDFVTENLERSDLKVVAFVTNGLGDNVLDIFCLFVAASVVTLNDGSTPDPDDIGIYGVPNSLSKNALSVS